MRANIPKTNEEVQLERARNKFRINISPIQFPFRQAFNFSSPFQNAKDNPAPPPRRYDNFCSRYGEPTTIVSINSSCFSNLVSVLFTDAYVHNIGNETFGQAEGILYERIENHSILRRGLSGQLELCAIDGISFTMTCDCREDWMKVSSISPFVTAQAVSAFGATDGPNGVMFRKTIFPGWMLCSFCNEQEERNGLDGALNVARQANILSSKHNMGMNTRNVLFLHEGAPLDCEPFADGPHLFLVPKKYIVKKPEINTETGERYYHNIYVVSWMVGFNRRCGIGPVKEEQQQQTSGLCVSASESTGSTTTPSSSPSPKHQAPWGDKDSATKIHQHSCFLRNQYFPKYDMGDEGNMMAYSYETEDLGIPGSSSEEQDSPSQCDTKKAAAIISHLKNP